LQPKRSCGGNRFVRNVHGVAVVVGKRRIIVVMIVFVTERQQPGEVKMRPLGMSNRFGHSRPGVRMRDRHALGKLHQNQDGENNATHSLVRFDQSIT